MTHPRILQLALPYATRPDLTHGMTCYEWGDAANPRVAFCVHGLTRTGRDFDMLAEQLAATHRVIAVDMPGRGLSEWLNIKEEYALPYYLAHLASLFALLGLQRVDWVGTSMGGMLGMLAAAAQPQSIRRLVLNDIGARIPATALERLAKYVGVQPRFETREAAETALRKAYASFGVKEQWQWRHLLEHSLRQTVDGAYILHYDPAIGDALHSGEPLQDIDLTDTWQSVSCPTLLIRGTESDLLPREVARQMAATHTNLTLHEVAGAGHAPTLMDEAEIALICGWLNT